ncbi:hypothetical protein CALVIDRAFT_152604 [Calocera viscosa TUFC12733]|uniref:Uncharacterized protein n=1 Tax=Calocera viscosa (strain TUFC12733) TaxID=1330018 RepID=A0A167LKZ0_CALVF|nr:hypothetical protein CALVIDRAFT_152604 [Calocera viscosa TUFC12733]
MNSQGPRISSKPLMTALCHTTPTFHVCPPRPFGLYVHQRSRCSLRTSMPGTVRDRASSSRSVWALGPTAHIQNSGVQNPAPGVLTRQTRGESMCPSRADSFCSVRVHLLARAGSAASRSLCYNWVQASECSQHLPGMRSFKVIRRQLSRLLFDRTHSAG